MAHCLQLKKKRSDVISVRIRKCLATAQRGGSLQFYRFYIELSRVTSSDDTAADTCTAPASPAVSFAIAFPSSELYNRCSSARLLFHFSPAPFFFARAYSSIRKWNPLGGPR